MKQKIFYSILTIIILMASYACNDNVLFLEQEGYVEFNTSLINNLASKAVVPECSSEPAVTMLCRFMNEDGFIYSDELDINIVDKTTVNVSGVMTLPVGNYTVDEISFFDVDGNITHTVPNTDDNFVLATYVSNPLPFDITVIQGATNTLSAQLMCYTASEPVINPDLSDDITVLELQTLFYNIPETSCIQNIVVKVDDSQSINYAIFEKGSYIHSVAVPVEYNRLEIAGYINGNMRQAFIFETNTPYDGSTIVFGDNCN